MSSKDQCLAKALNELRDANLTDLEPDAIGFVEQYFVNATVDGDDVAEVSDSDLEFSKSLNSEFEAKGDDLDFQEEPARPLVVVDGVSKFT